MADPHTCNGCHRSEPEVGFNLRSQDGRKYKRHLCKQCDNQRSKKYRGRGNKEAQRIRNVRMNKKKQEMRAANINTEGFILQDSRRSDKRKGMKNDLTREFIRDMIVQGCRYCGETELRMTLDRIDNAKGHTKDNVIPACIRCNYTRRSMPYEAWMMVANGLRQARILGLFGDWTGRGR